jgi:hypothetical protein
MATVAVAARGRGRASKPLAARAEGRAKRRKRRTYILSQLTATQAQIRARVTTMQPRAVLSSPCLFRCAQALAAAHLL